MKQQATVAVGRDLPLTANVTMRTQFCVNHLVTFASNDESVAVVNSETGLVHGIAPGTVTITATAVNDSTITDTVEVLVQVPNTFLLPTSLTVIESQAFTELPNVDSIRIPANVTSIATDAFDPGMVLLVPSGSSWIQWAENNGYVAIEE